MKLKKQTPLTRGAGVLLPVSSLPSPWGIGTFGQKAYDFIDFLKTAGQRYWQTLPLGPTGYGDSPYQSFSVFAGNPYFIDPDMLADEGLLTREELDDAFWGSTPEQVDYGALYQTRYKVLGMAHARSRHRISPEYKTFCEEHHSWLDDYALFMALKMKQGGREWLNWPGNIRFRQPKALNTARTELAEPMDFWRFLQYKFFKQWYDLKTYANNQGVEIIGDIPIYAALDSADVWALGNQFQLDENRRPTRTAGVPPDMFSDKGQLWGNPLYDWDRMEADGFSWWKRRMIHCADLYDIIRIDHFIGIVHYFSIPAEDQDAANGVWIKGPGESFIRAISGVMKDRLIIAEDLGLVTDELRKLQEKAGYPGMKLLEMGFDSDGRNINLPSYYEKNSIVYGGTHDNETLAGYFSNHGRKHICDFAREYLQVTADEEIPKAVIRAAYASAAGIAIFQMQDYLGLDNRARMNLPASLGGNWQWRLLPSQLTPDLAEELHRLSVLYGRIP